MSLFRRTCRLAGALLLLFLLGACSHTLQSTRLQQTPPQRIPPVWELGDTPFFAQSRYQCGPAALATMLAYRRVSVVPDDLTDKVYLPKREGSVTVEMEAAALFAVAQFRGVTLGQILYCGDDVSSEQWDSRHWQSRSSVREKMFWLAAEACLELG